MFIDGIIRGITNNPIARTALNTFAPGAGAVMGALGGGGGAGGAGPVATTRGAGDHQVQEADSAFRAAMTARRRLETTESYDETQTTAETQHNLRTRGRENDRTREASENAQETGHLFEETEELTALNKAKRERDEARQNR